MDLKLSISILVSAAYFLTLFLFNLSNFQNNIIKLLVESLSYSALVFVAIYSIILYVSNLFKKIKDKEAQEALEHIRQIEEDVQRIRDEAIQKRVKELEDEHLKRRDIEKKHYDIEPENEKNATDPTEKNIKQLKKESGTQFDENFNATNKVKI